FGQAEKSHVLAFHLPVQLSQANSAPYTAHVSPGLGDKCLNPADSLGVQLHHEFHHHLAPLAFAACLGLVQRQFHPVAFLQKLHRLTSASSRHRFSSSIVFPAHAEHSAVSVSSFQYVQKHVPVSVICPAQGSSSVHPHTMQRSRGARRTSGRISPSTSPARTAGSRFSFRMRGTPSPSLLGDRTPTSGPPWPAPASRAFARFAQAQNSLGSRCSRSARSRRLTCSLLKPSAGCFVSMHGPSRPPP